jgi:uncharacterized protein (DUF924 family)
MPFEHAEDLDEQDRCVALLRGARQRELPRLRAPALGCDQEFGRFPHRNPILGRTSTPAEEAYLAEPGAGF